MGKKSTITQQLATGKIVGFVFETGQVTFLISTKINNNNKKIMKKLDTFLVPIQTGVNSRFFVFFLNK